MTFEVTVLPGKNNKGLAEDFEPITFKSGECASIVGATGSGKTAFINDIELLAQGDTITGRKTLINGEYPSEDIRHDPAQKPIAMITQNTKCFTDLTVEDFLNTHARSRGKDEQNIVDTTINLANTFTGEKISVDMRVTNLSGGQTRSLMIADAIVIGAAPIILLDEVENAGIYKHKVIDTIKETEKIILYVTHDPVIALLSDKRIVMQNGAVYKVLNKNIAEVSVAEYLIKMDKKVGSIRESLREGNAITGETITRGLSNESASTLEVV